MQAKNRHLRNRMCPRHVPRTDEHHAVDASGQSPVLGSPKSAASERTITLPKLAIDVLDRHLDTHPPPETTVWTTEASGFSRRGALRRIWRCAVAESVGPSCRIYRMRHTHPAWLIAAGQHLKTIQTRLDATAAAVHARDTNKDPLGIAL